jgi:hypothetical protein
MKTFRQLLWATATLVAVGCGDGAEVAPEDGGEVDLDLGDAGGETGAADVAELADDTDSTEEIDADVAARADVDGSGEDGCGLGPACATDEHCVDGECRRTCRFDEQCAGLARCIDGLCAPNACARTYQCRAGAICDEGECITVTGAPCEGDFECGYGEGCVERRCVGRLAATRSVEFARWSIPGVSDRSGVPFGDDTSGYSLGGGLADIDGDLDLDILVAGDLELGPYSCVYRNTSLPGRPSFEAHPYVCSPVVPMTTALAGIDVENDGIDEIVVLGARQVDLVRFAPIVETIDLLELLPEDSPSRHCFAGAALATDLNYDGRIDLYVGCQIPSEVGNEGLESAMATLRNLIFLQNDDGGFSAAVGPEWEPLAATGVSLAIGAADLNADGLLDIMLADDTFSTVGLRRTSLPPGGTYRACVPGSACLFRYQRFVEDVTAFGSFMGFGLVATLTRGDLLYVADWGPNRLFEIDGNVLNDIAHELGVDLPGVPGAYWFAWALLVDDYDRNGLDDIYVGQGHIGVVESAPGYSDTLLLQQGDLAFEVRSDMRPADGSGEGSGAAALPFTRGGARADLDHDGLLELVLASGTRRIDVLTEVDTHTGDEPRCTLVPRPRVVPTYGVGYRVADAWTGIFRARDVQGSHRFGQSAHVLTSFGRGWLRFPSGAEVAFDCGGEPGPIVVEEPDWIAVATVDGELVIDLDATWLADTPEVVAALDRGGDEVEEVEARPFDGHWVVADAAGVERAMIRVDGRWVARWWELQP